MSFVKNGHNTIYGWTKLPTVMEEGLNEDLWFVTERRNCGSDILMGLCQPLQQEDGASEDEPVRVTITDSASVKICHTVCAVQGFEVDRTSVELQGNFWTVDVTLFYIHPLCKDWNITIPGVKFVYRPYPGKNQGYRILQSGIFGSVKNSLTEALCECSATAARKRKAGESSSRESKCQKSERRTSAFADEQEMQDVVEGDGSGHFLVSFNTDDERAMNFASLTLIAMQAGTIHERL